MSQNAKRFTAAEIMAAHQYLYYIGPSAGKPTIWSDFEYDEFCRAHGLAGGGGSESGV